MTSKPKPTDTPVSNASVTTLDNGLEVIIQEDAAHPLCSVQLWVRAGSIHEEAWTGAGLAHLTEHMMFKGTQNRTAQQISTSIQALGGQVNAYTSFNRTVYWIDGLAEHAEGYLEILADMTMRSKLDAGELIREMDVIRREMAMDNDDPASAGMHLMQATAFRRHPLRQPIIGHREVFDQVRHADLVAFVKRHYSPNNCFLVIAGDIDRGAVLAMARKHLGKWKRQPHAPVMLPEEPPQRAPRKNRVTFTTELTRLMLGWPIPGDAHEDKAALDVLAFLLGSGRSSRLNLELRDKRGLVHSVGAGAWCSAECGLFSVDAECDPSDTGKALPAMHEVIALMRTRGPARDELEKAVRATVAGQLRSQMSTRGQASILGNSWLITHSLDHGRLYLEALRNLTPAKVRQVAQKYLTPHTTNEVLVEPRDSDAVGLSARRLKNGRQDVEKFILANGLTLLIGQNSRLPLVSVRAAFISGVPMESDANAGITQVTAQMLLKGTKNRSANELAHVMEERGGSLHAHGDAHRLWVASEVMKGDEGLALDVMHDLLCHPVLPANQLPLIKKRQLAGIREEEEDPLTVALRRARKEIFAGTPFQRTALGTKQSVSALNIGDCRSLLRAHVVARNGVVAVFGDVDAASVRKQVQATFGKLPAGRRVLDSAYALPAIGNPCSIDLSLDKEQAVFVLGFRTVGLHHADNAVLQIIDEACSDMGSRLFNRIREELGLAYYVGAQQAAVWGGGAFYFYVGTSQEKVDLAQMEMLKLVADLARNGLRKDELERAKVTWRSNWLRAQQGNGPMADALSWDEMTGLGMEWFSKLPAIIQSISVKDTKRVAGQFFGAKSAYVVRVLPK